MRRTALVLLATALLAPTAATAKPVPKSSCAFADPAADARAPERDILCLDVATSRRDLTIVLHLDGTPGQDPAGTALGESWSASLVVYGVRILARLEQSPVLGQRTWSVTVGDAPARLRGVYVDPAHRTVRWTAELPDLLSKRPTFRVSSWAAQTKLGVMSDDMAGGPAPKR